MIDARVAAAGRSDSHRLSLAPNSMANVWSKIDSGLARMYSQFLRSGKRAGEKVHVLMRYSGDLEPVARAGFEIGKTDGRYQASGYLLLEKLEVIALCDEVVSIRRGSEHFPVLDESIPQIRADQVWTQGGAPLFEYSGTTGEGVIVGIIDSGCDIKHPFLWRKTIPPAKETRILRLWDQGLQKITRTPPAESEKEPDLALLDSLATVTYGVEYTNKHINDVIQGVAGAMPVRTRDCSGHGTHVASIAAGDGRFKFKFRGVAPRADLVIVKFFFPEHRPPVANEQTMRDAVSYILNVADSFSPKRPVVINFSGGPLIGAHDGFDEESQFLNDLFADATSKGKIFVNACGNSGGVLKDPPNPPARQHARIEFTGATTIEIPFELFDTRTVLDRFETCVAKDGTLSHFIDFWYPFGGATIKGKVLFQGETTFEGAPLLNSANKTGTFGPAGRDFEIEHKTEPGTDGTSTIPRNLLRIRVDPGAGIGHATGQYFVELEASAAITMHCWTFQHRKEQGFRIEDPATGLPPEVIVENRFEIDGASAVPNVIAVAAYDAVSPLAVASFSSRGPIVRYGAGGPPPAKPDIGAPGVKVDAAKSRHTMPVPTAPAKSPDTRPLNGTSMAAPHVTGVVALMLQKKGDLTPSQVRAKLKAHALKVPAPVAVEIGAGRLDAKTTVDNTP